MARRAFKITTLSIAGGVSAALVLMLTLGTLAAVFWRADGLGNITAADWDALRFTLMQAFLSALLSIALAIPVARALARRRFLGRSILIALMGAPFILPSIVAVLGLVAVFGQSGLIGRALVFLGFEPFSIYGLHGILLAHVFFNLPLATRLILQGWLAIPGEHFRLAQTLRFRPLSTLRVIEFPMLREIVPGAFTVIFVLCTTSFAVALALGAGPKSTTIELAIYQAFRFDFDLGSAALLGLIQLGICALAAAAALWVRVPQMAQGGLDRVVAMPPTGAISRAADTLFIVFAAAFLLLPLGSILVRGLFEIAELPPVVWHSALRSCAMALGSALLTIALSLPLAWLAASNKRAGLWAEGAGFLTIAASPLVMGTGLFILLYGFVNPVDWALAITVFVNAAMALPFAMRALVPAISAAKAQFGPLAQSLDLRGWAAWRWLWWPRLRGALGFSAGLSGALSMGDLGVIALFADPDRASLPLQMYRLMAAYRMDQAAGAALLLLGLSLAIFWLFDRGGRVNAEA
ncbi:MAG: thiamine/thiamine pyrophosphate ABC transporter permease ThiP [Paracoccaceae bacterium]